MKRSMQTRRSFTLVELLVVMGVIAVLAGITVLGYRGITKDAKMSSAKNTIMAALDNARGLAMRNNEIVCVVFRARFEGEKKQYIEIVTAKWSRQSSRITVPFQSNPAANQVVDRFVPIPGVASRRLPVGIKIAAPFYGGNQDESFICSTHLPTINQTTGDGEAPGDVIGVMYSPDGRTITRNSFSDSNRSWVDFNNNNLQDWGGLLWDYNSPAQPGSQPTSTLPGGDCVVCSCCPVTFSASQYCYSLRFGQRFEDDESYIDFVPFLAVFDDDDFRELADVSRWSTASAGNNACNQRRWDYSRYIGDLDIGDPTLPRGMVDRIHFNRYTGVALR